MIWLRGMAVGRSGSPATAPLGLQILQRLVSVECWARLPGVAPRCLTGRRPATCGARDLGGPPVACGCVRQRYPASWALQAAADALRRGRADNLHHADVRALVKLGDPVVRQLARGAHLRAIVQDGVRA